MNRWYLMSLKLDFLRLKSMLQHSGLVYWRVKMAMMPIIISYFIVLLFCCLLFCYIIYCFDFSSGPACAVLRFGEAKEGAVMNDRCQRLENSAHCHAAA